MYLKISSCIFSIFSYNLISLIFKPIKMTTETILKPIGNWQITIPLSRREYLNIDKKHVKARLEAGRIIIEPLQPETLDRDIKLINLNTLNSDTQKVIKQSRQNYKKWKKDKFISHDIIRNGI